eukprot:5503940-Prymnesium_polylepis.1
MRRNPRARAHMPHSSRPLTSAAPERHAHTSRATPSRFLFMRAPFSRASGARLCPCPIRIRPCPADDRARARARLPSKRKRKVEPV